MSVQTGNNGKRWVQVEIDVPGTQQEVWRAVATGPGVTAWFVPTIIANGQISAEFGPGMEAQATVTAWDAPHRFAAESADLGPDAPPLCTEWSVTPAGEGTCTVRVTHSLACETDEWDAQLASVEAGWPSFFRILKAYLTHFPGQPCTPVRASATVNGKLDAFWHAAGETGEPPVLRLTTQPAPGILFLNACQVGCCHVFASVSLYLYGDVAPEVAETEQARWQAWLQQFA